MARFSCRTAAALETANAPQARRKHNAEKERTLTTNTTYIMVVSPELVFEQLSKESFEDFHREIFDLANNLSSHLATCTTTAGAAAAPSPEDATQNASGVATSSATAAVGARAKGPQDGQDHIGVYTGGAQRRGAQTNANKQC
jgi:hypothetical protein